MYVLVVALRDVRRVLVVDAALGEIVKERLHESVDPVQIGAGHSDTP